MLLVLAVQEAGLRSALAAQLAMAGASLITAKDVDDPSLMRGVRRPAVLVMDMPTVNARPDDWLANTLDDLRWNKVVILSGTSAATHPKLVHCEPIQAVEMLTENVPLWKADAA